MDVFKIILLGLLIFVITNVLVYFLSKDSKKRMTRFGILMLLLSPIVFYVTLEFAGKFDPGGFGAGIFGVFYGILFFINGIVYLFISA
ncbi:hypothetical protein ACQKKK_20190 [Peribacillus sp. NPDC006672]|uniref:hypothetical protein n=1 Tax=Peribacillus sp. NPDC006672 TaxID=3390606 RepID=UPI003D05ABE7